MFMSKLDTYFLEVNAHVLLKLAAKDSIRSKKSKNLVFLLCFFKAKTEECHKKKFEVPAKDLASLYLVQLLVIRK